MEQRNKQDEIVRIVETYSDMLLRIAPEPTAPPTEEVAEAYSPESFELLETVRQLPEKDRDAVYLFYYESYSTAEIAKLLGEREGTPRTEYDDLLFLINAVDGSVIDVNKGY